MKSKKILAIIMALMMLLSVCPASVLAAAVPDTQSETAAEESETPAYTYEELVSISEKNGYDLTQDQIQAVLSGEKTLSEIVGDQEEDVTMIVQLSSEGAIAADEKPIDANGDLSEAVLKEQKSIEKQQSKVQNKVEKKVFKGEDMDVMYSYSLLTNAFAIQAKPSQINEIAAVKGVESVYTAPIYEPVPTDASSVTTDDQKAEKYFTNSDNTTSNKGTGTVVAIIDTGLDCEYTYNSSAKKVTTTFHEAFQNDVTNPKINAASVITNKWTQTKAYSRVAKLNSNIKTAFKNSIYRSSKVPFAFNYGDDNIFAGHKYNSNLETWSYWSWAFNYFYDDEQGDHGTHVAGITAGYATDSEGKVLFEGVAPDAQLLVMKVFGKNRAGNFADILAAMEDAVLLGADVINLSLGSWAGFTYGGDRPEYDAAFKAAADAGVVVCASAGNEYSAGKGNLYGTEESLASNPDNGILGSPASYDDNLAVASMSSKSYYAKSVSVDGRGIAYTNNATEDVRSIEKYSGTTKGYALLKDDAGNLLTGTPGDFENYAKSSGIKGKFAVIRRGETFTETVARAEDAGAIGLIVCDHSDGSLVNMMENNDVEIPAIFISKADGDYLVDLESNPNTSHELVITDDTTYINNPTAGEMSDFSSWGVTPDLKLKPEITGYGGSVYSTLQGNKYGLMSGTSMSSPYLAGVAALVAQRINAMKAGTLQYAEETFDFFENGLAAATIENNHGYGLTNQYISAIGGASKVAYTEAFKQKIEAARASYDALSDAQKAKVTATQLKKLTDAEAAFETKKETARANADNNAKADAVITLIDEIGTPDYTEECAAKVSAARTAYNALTAAQKKLVLNYTKLTTAEAVVNGTDANVTATETLINAIGTVTASSSAILFKIKKAQDSYNALTDLEKARVSNYAKVTFDKGAFSKSVMMSTAAPVLFDSDAGTLYSPRKQGAGLVNIDAALASNAYVSVNGSQTPKLDLGDDKAKSGVYELTFDVVNIGSEALTFDVSANVQTEKVDIQDVSYQTRRLDPEKAAAFKETGLPFSEKSYAHRVYAIDELKDVKFMSGEPYDLTAMSTVTGANTITVPAGETATVTLTVTLGADAKAYMDENFVNGIYVEGFVTLTSKTAGQPNLTVPYMGFYGDWTQAPMLDEGTWEDNYLGNPVHPQMSVSTGANVYWGSMVGNYLYPLGTPNSDGKKTPYDIYEMGGTYLKDVRNVFGGKLSLNANMIGAELGLLRSAKTIHYTITDTKTGKVYATANRDYVRKSIYYSDSVGMVNAGYFDSDLFKWDGKIDGTQNYIEPGTQVTYSVEVLPDYGTEETVNNLRNTFSFNAYYDGETPKIDSLKVYLDEDTSDVMLDIAASDDYFLGEISYSICGYVEGEVEETTYLHTLFMPETKGGAATETLNLSEWARTGGLKQMRSVCITLSDFCQKDAVNEHPVFSSSYDMEYWISFFDKVKVSSVTDILPVGSEGQLNVDYIYGRKLLAPDTPWYDAEGDANNNDYGLEEDFIYLSSNPEVLRVTSEGKLIPVSAGYADVTATGRYGKATDSMRIRVVEDPTQLQVAAANAGDTVTVSEDVAASSLLIDKDIVIDLNGHTLHGVDGSPAIRVIGGNVTIKNGSVDAVYSDNSQNAPLIDILEDNVPAILVEGGNVTLENLKIQGATIDVDGEDIIAGSAVVLKDDGNLTVKSSDLLGLYAINNSEAANNATLISGNFEGVLGAVSDMKKVSAGEGSEFIDITNTLADDTLSYLGTIEGGTADYYLPQTGLYISAEQLANATVHGNASIVYDAEKGCATLTFNTDGSTTAPDQTFLEIPDVNIANAEDYTFAAIVSNGVPFGSYAKASFSSSDSYNNDYLSGENDAPIQDGTVSNYVKALAPCTKFTGNTPTLYYWPAAKSWGGVANASMDIYGIELFNNKADATSFAVGTANAYTNNLKVAAPQSFNTQMVIDGTTLNVSTSFPDESDGKYKWTANELALYTRVADGDNNFTDTFVESKPITPDENGDVSVAFEGIDPSKAYVVKVKFALALTADSKSNFFSLSEASAAGLVKAFPTLLDDMLGVDKLEASVADLLNFFLYDMRQGFIERDARHYDCPLGRNYITKYPFYDEYPDIIPQNSNNDYTTWLSYWDNRTFNEFIGTDKVNYDDTVTRISFAVLFASILGDAKMAELMANIESTVPAKTWNMLNPEMRVGNFGLVGSIPTYKAQLEGLQNAATGATPREQLVNAVSYLANNFIDLYASVLSVINSTYTEGVSFASYSDPTANDSLLNVMQGKVIQDHYAYGKYNDRQDVLVEKLNAVYDAIAYIQNAKNGLMKAMNAALYGTLASYQTEASDLMNLYFGDEAIPGGTIDLGITAEYEAQANYDGFITYELNGGVNNAANPIGYQRILPVTFAEPTKEGFTFGGWYTSADFAEGTEITGTTAETDGDLTLYAKWEINSYTMTFMNGDEVVDKLVFAYGEQTHATDRLTIDAGMTFKYWYENDAAKEYVFGTMPANDVTLHAQLGYMSIDDFDLVDGVYVWPKNSGAALHLAVDKDCTIDFGGKVVTNMSDLEIITVENGAKVTIKNAVFQPAAYQNTADANYTIYVTGHSELTFENCVVKGAKAQGTEYYACSAIKVDDGTVAMDNCVVSGLYAVDNTKGTGVLASPSVTYTTGIYTGMVAPFAVADKATCKNAQQIDISALVADADAAAALAGKAIITAPNFDVTDFAFEYLPDNDEVLIKPVNTEPLTLPDGSSFYYTPVKAKVDEGEFQALTDGSVTIGNFMVGERILATAYELAVQLNDTTAAELYQIDDGLTTASIAEIAPFDALMPEYTHIIKLWNNNKDKIISKFAQYADNAILAPYLKDIRTCVDNISGTGSTEGILPKLESKINAYKELTTDAEKLQWMFENKSETIALTVALQENVNQITADCIYLNALAQTFFGTDYSDKLARVYEMNDEIAALRVSAEKQPSLLAAEYAAAEDKTAFVNALFDAPQAYDGETTVNGSLDLGNICQITARISKTDPPFTIPTFTALRGTKLSDLTLPNSCYTWVDGDIQLNTVGNMTYQAVYTHENTEKYNPVTFDVPVEVITPRTYCERNGHDFTEIVVQPTCTTDGKVEKICKTCGVVILVEVFEATGHTDNDDDDICDVCGEEVPITFQKAFSRLTGGLAWWILAIRKIIQAVKQFFRATGSLIGG